VNNKRLKFNNCFLRKCSKKPKLLENETEQEESKVEAKTKNSEPKNTFFSPPSERIVPKIPALLVAKTDGPGGPCR
jgi:hypothetical protein